VLSSLSLALAQAPPALAAPPKIPVGTFTAQVDREATTGWGIVVLRYVDAFESWRNKQARIAPEAGANLFSFSFGGHELLLQPAVLADLVQQRTGMPVLFPTPNRVRDAQMTRLVHDDGPSVFVTRHRLVTFDVTDARHVVIVSILHGAQDDER
jgi:hypothetical protein